MFRAIGLVVIGIPPIPPNSSASTIVEHRFIWLREYDLILGALPVCWNTETVQQVFFSEKSSHAGFMFYFSSRSPAQTSPHIILIRFLSSPAFTRDIKLYHRRTADIRRVGGDQLRPHYDPEIKTVCIVYIWQDKTTQLDPSELRLVLVIVLVRQTGGDQARRSEIWKACYHHHQATGRHRFYRKILHHNPCLTESP